MCQQLRSVRQALREIAERFDAAEMAASEAEAVVADLTAIESTAGGLKAMAAARAAESQSWRRDGHRSAAEALASRTGSTVGAARRVLEVGRCLGDHPDLSAAASRGELSATQSVLVAEAADVDPGAAVELVELAARGSLSELKERVAQIKTAACDPEQRRRRSHERRSVRRWIDTDGAWHLHATGNVEDGAHVDSTIDWYRDDIFKAARAERRREHPDAYAFDALVAMCKDLTGDLAPPGRTSAGPLPGDRPEAEPTSDEALEPGGAGSRIRERYAEMPPRRPGRAVGHAGSDDDAPR